MENGQAVGDSKRVLCLPDVRGRDAFAAYLPDDAMAPAFGKGDLVVFSLVQEVADGAPALVDLGEGQAVFRRVLQFPGGGLRLEAANPKVEPVLQEKAEDLRMWPAIGRWEWLVRRRRR
ncbi:MAG: S24 family peptidase [Phycisphaerae bacterium]